MKKKNMDVNEFLKDRNNTMQMADDIGIELSKTIMKLISEKKVEDTPLEYIYLVGHSLANFTYRLISGMEGYSKTYGVDALTQLELYKWIRKLTKEFIDQNKNVVI